MGAPDVTIVVPNYNGARFLAQTLESLLAQSDPDFQLIVADNASTDDSVAIARGYRDERLTVVTADTTVPMSQNWNRCLRMIRTAFGVLAHADDLYERDFLRTLVPLLRARADAFAAHCRVGNLDEHGSTTEVPAQQYKERFWPAGATYCREPCEEARWLRNGNYILAPSVVYRMEHVRAIGEFNPRFQFVPDWEYWLRGVFAGYRIVGTREPLVRYRRHGSSLTKAAEQNLSRYREELELLAWVAPRGHEAGCFPDARPRFDLVTNTLTSELADRLATGDRIGARRLAAFARDQIPGFTWSARDIVTRAAVALGAVGGRLLRAARAAYLSTAARPVGEGAVR